MKKFRSAIPPMVPLAIIGVVIVGLLGLWLAMRVPQWLGFFGGKQKVYNTTTVLRQVQTLSQLVTVKYVMEKVIIHEDQQWYGENRVLIVAHGIVKGGVDFSKMQPDDVKISGKKISIRLPPPHVTDAYLDDKRTRVVERTTGLLRTFDKDLEQTARQRAVMDIHRAAREEGILKDADERAQAQVKSMLLQLGFEEVEFLPR
jgi:hypothetical protein